MREAASSAAAPAARCRKFRRGSFIFEPPFTSFDHLVGDGEDPGRHGKTKGSRCLEIDNELELGRPQHWQVGGRPSPEKTPDVDAGLTITILDIGSVSHEPTRIGVLARLVNRGDGMSCC